MTVGKNNLHYSLARVAKDMIRLDVYDDSSFERVSTLITDAQAKQFATDLAMVASNKVQICNPKPL